MKRRKFLSQLKKALKHDLSAKELKENIDYYDQYIRDEVKKGYTEEEVVASLGDPWIIAKTVRTQVHLEEDETETQNTTDKYEHKEKQAGKAKIILRLLVTLVILIAIIALILKMFLFALKILLPIILIIFLVRLFAKK